MIRSDLVRQGKVISFHLSLGQGLDWLGYAMRGQVFNGTPGQGKVRLGYPW